MLYLFVAVFGVYAYGRVIGKAARFTVITGKAYRPRVYRLGLGRWTATGVGMLYLALAVAIPFLVLIYVSFLPYVQPPSWRALASMNLDHYEEVFQAEGLGHVLWNTLVMTITTALAVVVFSFLISAAALRCRFWGRPLPQALPFHP